MRARRAKHLVMDSEESRFFVALKSVFAGTISGICGKIVEYPADTIKVRLQTQGMQSGGAAASSSPSGTRVAGGASSGRYTGPVDCLKTIVKDEGFAALYKGIASPIAGAALENTAVFLLYDQTKLAWIRAGYTYSMDKVAVSGALAGCGTTVVLTPVELVKCRMQIQRSSSGPPKYSGVVDCARQIIRAEGVRGMFRGTASTALREVPGNAVWFGTYELVGRRLAPTSDPTKHENPLDRPLPTCMLAGGVAGSLYWAIPYPFDTVKSYMQTAANPPATVADGFKAVYRSGGLRALYQGLSVTAFRAFFSNGIIFMVYELTVKIMNKT